MALNWRIGLSSYTYPWAVGMAGWVPERPLTVWDLLDRARALDVAVLQIADNLPLHQLSVAEVHRLADQARSDQIDLEVGTRGIAPDILARDLQIAATLHSPLLRVVVDHGTHEPLPADIVQLLRPWETEFRRVGITLAIENHDRLPAATLASIVHDLGDWVGICLDTVNSLGALEGPDIVLEALGPYTVNLHAKDFDIVRANSNLGFDVRGRPLGQGRLDLATILSRAGRAGTSLSAVIELWTPQQGTLADTITREQTWAEASVTYLRKVIEKTHVSVPQHEATTPLETPPTN